MTFWKYLQKLRLLYLNPKRLAINHICLIAALYADYTSMQSRCDNADSQPTFEDISFSPVQSPPTQDLLLQNKYDYQNNVSNNTLVPINQYSYENNSLRDKLLENNE